MRRPRRRRKPLPPDPVEATIQSLSHEARGIARIDGKTVFVDGALPGELVTFRYTRLRAKYAEGMIESVIEPSPDRVEPRCVHAGICGGCSLQHVSGAAQLRIKQAAVLEQLAYLGKVEPDSIVAPMTGPQWGYRHKARLGVRYVEKKQRLLVGFREKRSQYLAELNLCEVLHPAVGRRIEALSEMIASLDAFREIAQIEVAAGENAVALIFRHLAELGDSDLQTLRQFGEASGLQIWLQPGGSETITPFYPESPEPLHYDLGEGKRLFFHPADFTQVNPQMNRSMIDQAIDWLRPQPTDHLLELFCGLGNFTLRLAPKVAAITAVEGAPDLVQRGGDNLREAGSDNVTFHIADLEKDIAGAPWLDGEANLLLLDPPRPGALAIVRELPLKNIERIVYISCNPATFARDAGELVHNRGYRLLRFGLMDMFPHTRHVETMALFEPQ